MVDVHSLLFFVQCRITGNGPFRQKSQHTAPLVSKHKVSISEGDALVKLYEGVEKRRLTLKPKPAIPTRIVSSNRFSVLDDDDDDAR